MAELKECIFSLYCCMYANCNKEYRTKQNLKRHISISHLLSKQITCSICSKKFLNSINIKEHYLIHTNSKPYRCLVCNKQFRHKSKFGMHKREHLLKREEI